MIRNKERHLISYQTREDIISSIMEFEEVCMYKLKSCNASITSCCIKSEVNRDHVLSAENITYGTNTNQTYLSYCYSVNSVIFGQTSESRKANVGGGDGGHLPLNCDAKSMV